MSVALVASLAQGHGASKGLHVHVEPNPAVPGRAVTVTVDATTALAVLEIGFEGYEAIRVRPDPPTRKVDVAVAVPADLAGDVGQVQAEGRTIDGRTLRASRIVRIAPTPPP